MAFSFGDLWRWDGKIGRRTYAIVGFLGFAIKHNLDRYIATLFFRRNGPDSAHFFNYWAPLGKAARLTHLSSAEAKLLATLLLTALPFIWVGIAMTLRRLRDAGLPVWLVVLFFAPFVNLLFFAALCLLPPHERPLSQQAAPWPGPRSLDSIIPHSKLGSAALSIVLTTAIGLTFAVLGVSYFGAYGWSLFVGLPFCLGLFSVLVYSYHEPRGLNECLQVAILPVAVLGVLLIAVAVEGVICVVMAAPLGLALTGLGGWVGYFIQLMPRHSGRDDVPALMSVVLLLAPALFGMERAAALPTPAFVVRTSIDVQAPPEVVWQQVLAFSEIPPPTELLFRAGVAYPIRAEISGHGSGAIRHCIFSTGPFVEPIEVWDEPRLLKFAVTANPAPLNELTPYGHIEPRHLHGYFLSEEGQFLLTPLPGGGTRLEGTTWYRDAIWPTAYWRLWSDYIIHRIHLRVLNHIRDRAESPAAKPR
jgi:uncharacterized membrane protein YhaH (DUF805 family)